LHDLLFILKTQKIFRLHF